MKARTTRTFSALWKFCASQAITETSTATKAANTILSQPSASLIRSALDMDHCTPAEQVALTPRFSRGFARAKRRQTRRLEAIVRRRLPPGWIEGDVVLLLQAHLKVCYLCQG